MSIKIGNYAVTRRGIKWLYDKFLNTPSAYFKTDRGGSCLNGKIALVTGAYRGIGLAIVKSFLREGAKVILTGRTIEQIQKVYGDFKDKSVVNYMQWDIADKENGELLMKKAFALYGPVDILVNNAGVVTTNTNLFIRKKFVETTEEYIKYIHNVNVIGTIAMCNTFLKYAEERKAKIINIISNTAFRPAPDAYGMSKWALLSYTKAFADITRHRVIVNGIAPGPVMSAMSWAEGLTILRQDCDNLRLGLPEEIAELAVMLAGKTGDNISGKVFLCDGGGVLK